MKKTIVLLILSMILMLVGCGSGTDSNSSDKELLDQETERIKNEIDKANSMTEVNNTTEPTKEQDPAESTEISSTPAVQKTLEDMTEEEKFDYYAKKESYYLGGMTSDEIVSTVVGLLEKYPKDGEKYDEMTEKYNSPIAFGEQNKYLNGEVEFVASSANNRPGLYAHKSLCYIGICYNKVKDSDYIWRGVYKNIFETQMDGTVTLGCWKRTVSTNYPIISIHFCIQNYEKATEVYDKLIENRKKAYENIDSDEREGSSWHAEFSVRDGNSILKESSVSLSLYEPGNCYLLSVSEGFQDKSFLVAATSGNQ